MRKLIIVVFLIFSFVPVSFAETQKAVLITGASSGLGAKMMEVLRTNGFFVYATALTDADVQRLINLTMWRQ